MEFNFKEASNDELNRFVMEVLEPLELKSATRRKNMFKKGHGHTEPKGAYSVVYGYTNSAYLSPTKSRVKIDENLYETTLKTQRPDLQEKFQQLVNLFCPEPFEVSMVQINCNWRSPRHKDKGNQDESWIIGLGEYEEGELIIEYDKPEVFDIKNKFLKFNGAKHFHYTNPWIGKRYSLVFFKHKKISKSIINEL